MLADLLDRRSEQITTHYFSAGCETDATMTILERQWLQYPICRPIITRVNIS